MIYWKPNVGFTIFMNVFCRLVCKLRIYVPQIWYNNLLANVEGEDNFFSWLPLFFVHHIATRPWLTLNTELGLLVFFLELPFWVASIILHNDSAARARHFVNYPA